MRALSLVLLAIVSTIRVADAGSVTFFFGGTITSVDAALETGFTVGQRLIGYYTVEADTPDESALPTFGQYPAITAAGLLTLAESPSARYAAHAVGGQIDVADQPALDSYAMYALAGVDGPAVGAATLERFQLQLNDPTATAFSSDAVPLRVRLRRFESSTFVLEFSGEQFVRGEITSLVRGLPPV